MRTREDIKEEALANCKSAGANYPHGVAIVELLLDIRGLLASPTLQQDYGKAREELSASQE